MGNLIRRVLLISVTGAFLASACTDNNVILNSGQLEQRSDGLTYENKSENPFTGTVKDHFDDDTPQFQISYQNGKAHGASYQWWKNGQLASEILFKNGMIIEKKTWDINGNVINN